MPDRSHLKFSIVIPSYNRAALIGQTLESVMAQSYSSFEVIVVDDGSSDDTGSIVQEYQNKDERCGYYYITNRERGAARNYGIQKARGEYIVFIDSDDIMHSNHLTTLDAAIKQYEYPAFLATKYRMYNGSNYYTSDIASFSEGFYDYTLLLKGNPFSCNFCVRRDCGFIMFEEDRKYSTFEDWIFLINNLRRGNLKILLIDAITITMNDHADRSMRVNHTSIINKRIATTQSLERVLALSTEEKKRIWAYSYYFCAIHAYLENNRKRCFYLLSKAFHHKVHYQFFLLAIKAIIGQNIITKIISR